ncbi:MAG: hypothetical protein QXJ75_00435 [Candidatus Bathyarchaeia archaeon]
MSDFSPEEIRKYKLRMLAKKYGKPPEGYDPAIGDYNRQWIMIRPGHNIRYTAWIKYLEDLDRLERLDTSPVRPETSAKQHRRLPIAPFDLFLALLVLVGASCYIAGVERVISILSTLQYFALEITSTTCALIEWRWKFFSRKVFPTLSKFRRYCRLWFSRLLRGEL